MKYLIYLLLICPTLLFAQWIQIGSDIYGDVSDRTNKIAMNAQGDRIAIGAPLSNAGGATNAAGQVKVFDLIGGEWIQIGSSLQGNVNADHKFGESVSLSADGSILAVGIVEGGLDKGRVEVFEFDGTDWVQLGQTVDGINTLYFGRSVRLSDDGLKFVVGGQGGPGGPGLVQVYELIAGSWMQIGQDIIGNQFEEIGNDVSINSDGTIIAIGSTRAQNPGNLFSGRVRMYQIQGNSWVQMGGDLIGSVENDNFGFAVDLNSTGVRVAIGIPFADDVGNDNKGSVEVYQFDGSEWVQLGNTVMGTIRRNLFGASVRINDAGDSMIVGSPDSDPNIPYEGAVRFFKYNGQSWVQYGLTLLGDDVEDGQGATTAINSDGSVIGFTAPGSDMGGNQSGRVRVYNTESLLGIAIQNPEISISVFPNPSNGSVSIHCSTSIDEMVVYDSLGKVVLRKIYRYGKKSIDLEIDKLELGVYIAKFTAQNGSFAVKKIIKS